MKAISDLRDDRGGLEKLSVKDLRRRAALHNCQLTHIAAAIEKDDLINLIRSAGPIRDTYDMSLGVKVHTADTIATELAAPKPKEKKKKKKRKRSSSSSSTRSSSSRRKKKRSRSKSRRRSKSPRKKEAKRKDRSPSLEMVAPPKAPPLRALPAASGAGVAVVATAGMSPAAKAAAARTRAKGQPRKPAVLKALPDVVETILDDNPRRRGAETILDDEVQKVPDKPRQSVAQAGMAAAAKMGFNVVPKASHAPQAPAPGLRPSANSAAAIPGAVPGGAPMVRGSRTCVSYLCFAQCHLGANCPEAHIVDPEEEMRVRARFKQQECNMGDKCNRHNCLFRHPGEKVDECAIEGQQKALGAAPPQLSDR